MTESSNPETTKPAEGVAAESAETPQDAKAKFRAALEAKKARQAGSPDGGRAGGASSAHAHGAAGGQKMFRRKSG